MQKLKIAFILNPKAGGKKNNTLKKNILEIIDPNRFEITITETNYAGEARILSQQFVQEKYYAVIAVGGDGTVNEVAKPLISSSTALGIIPKGSGNGLARVLKISLHEEKALEIINNQNLKNIDTGKANEEIFVNNCGVGIDAFISSQIKHSKIRGLKMYAKQVLYATLKYKSNSYTIYYDNDIEIYQKALLISVANGHEFGFGFNIAPKASISDGVLDVTIIKACNKLQQVTIALKMKLGNILKHKYVQYVKTKKLKIENNDLKYFQVDGDTKTCDGKLEISILPSTLRVIVP